MSITERHYTDWLERHELDDTQENRDMWETSASDWTPVPHDTRAEQRGEK